MNVKLLRVLMVQRVRIEWMTTNVNAFQALTDATVKSVSLDIALCIGVGDMVFPCESFMDSYFMTICMLFLSSSNGSSSY